jgi:putative tricarboxylic transport membrane protein
MTCRPSVGELVLACAFGGVGLYWTLTAAAMPLWDGFSPSSAFLPLVYGLLLVLLSAAVIIAPLLHGRADERAAGESVRKPILVSGALLFAAVATEPLGFATAIFAMLLFLYAVVERLPLVVASVVSAATAGILSVVFRTWLGVPLPLGPWGF